MSSNYVIPPRYNASDYDKYARAQDEIIALQIANDANIANARKQVKLGTPPQLTTQEAMSPEELLANIGQQEANARGNLEKLGFRPQESSDIIAAIRRDPSIDFSQLNSNFPSIEADIKKRFNVKLLTSTFFIEYFKKYSDDLAGAVGMKVFSPPNSDAKINGLINNVAEIRRLIPDPTQIAFLETAARNAGIRDAMIMGRLNALQQGLPTAQQLDNLSRLDPVTQQQMINDILVQTQYIPSRREIENIIQGIATNSLTSQQIYDVVERLANVPQPKGSSIPAPRATKSGSSKRRPVPEDGGSFILDANTKWDDVKAAIIKYGMENDITDLQGNPVSLNELGLSTTPFKKFWRNTNLDALFEAKFPSKMGSGIRFRTPKMSSIEPKIKLKVGRGIAVKQMPTYREFGKYAIHIPQLENNDFLNIKYKSLGPVPKFKPVAVSDIFRDFLLDVLETGKPNARVYSQISPEERKLFEELSISAGVFKGFGLQRTTISEDEQENTRFELLRGEFLAGNNHPKMIQELRKLIIKFMSDGRIKKHEGLTLLQQLN